MKKCYLDTNILIASKIEDSPHHVSATNLFTKFIHEETDLYISPLIIDEFLHPMKYFLGLKFKNVFPYLLEVLKDILFLPNLTLVNPPTDMKSQLELVKLMETYNLKPRDAYHLLIMQSNQIDMFATFDRDFDEVFQEGVIRHYKGETTS